MTAHLKTTHETPLNSPLLKPRRHRGVIYLKTMHAAHGLGRRASRLLHANPSLTRPKTQGLSNLTSRRPLDRANLKPTTHKKGRRHMHLEVMAPAMPFRPFKLPKSVSGLRAEAPSSLWSALLMTLPTTRRETLAMFCGNAAYVTALLAWTSSGVCPIGWGAACVGGVRVVPSLWRVRLVS